jgi:TfoX/Sxy family transcriptional regulator of competence genes
MFVFYDISYIFDVFYDISYIFDVFDDISSRELFGSIGLFFFTK